eukprot:Protomagalhaensia_sp_Gyna_25__5627@NODE_785_length_2623_cov_19_254257_g616_i0_p1_GENE_NODE_785_length_2623_cov_19_254257_g616_i0NODE_785_length_2623_cov_19_254257_g616_i0_p1_ORF_typecomplete_len642_score64_36FAD_binding_3/PF01494_19/6e46Lycopene_cycl/PF05834_12/6e08Lycopene_cycl/PF05834_12/26Thi4/PF01946_17/0_00014DAO/PF01266_24/0_00094FAD_oxidored/PF12831_7/0_0035SE/PF08491_10/5_5e03SE/PF08491_10/0_0065HI0933_like/PF03486_14/0_027Pyr_redox_3/PF13738_6/0_34Pyr_redox_3/PF13738_6/3e03Pyr_redox_2/P
MVVSESTSSCTLVEDFDVVICGAGPTGLIMALQMVLGPAPPRTLLIDKRVSRSTHSRAFVIWQRNIESIYRFSSVLYHKLKDAALMDPHVRLIIEEVLDVSTTVPRMNVDPASIAQTSWVISQFVIESILEQFLLQMAPSHFEFRRNCELQRIEPTMDNRLIVGLSSLPSRVRTRYLIGCDGVRSDSRRLAHIPFSLRPKSFVVWLADGELEPLDQDHPVLRPGFCVVVSATHGITGFIRLEGDKYRFLLPGPALPQWVFALRTDASKTSSNAKVECESDKKPAHTFHTDSLTNPTTDDVIRAANPAANSLGLKVKGVSITSAVRFTYGLPETWSAWNHRVLLSGDAAHVHSASGGQGMNLGMQDAFNLGWKLRLLLSEAGITGQELLRSFELERKPIARSVVDKTYRGSTSALRSEDDCNEKPYRGLLEATAQRLARWFLWHVLAYSLRLFRGYFAPSNMWMTLTQLTFDYSASFCCSERWHNLVWSNSLVPRRSPGAKAGVSLPFVEIDVDLPSQPSRTGSSLRAFLCSLCVQSGFTLVYIPPTGRNLDDDWKMFISKRSAYEYASWIGRVIAIYEKEKPAAFIDPSVIWVKDRNARAILTPYSSESCAYIIRPDGFIGHRSRPFNLEALEAFFRIMWI